MTYEEFAKRAREVFDAIPERFRARVDGPVVERGAHEHEHVPGSYVLGECHHHPDWTGESPLHSTVVIYHGSFLELARGNPEFDIAEELVDTVLHEVQHHVEDAAGIDRLRDYDWAQEQNDRRLRDLSHATRFWRSGFDLGGGLHRIDADLFLEVPLRTAAWEHATAAGLVLDVLGFHVELRPDDVPPPAVTASLVLDWDWSLVPDDVDLGSAGHEHGALGGWGDLVVVFERRRTLAWGGTGRVVT